ncbi:MAG: 5-(carboxyamino)imidazole ribonucleotide synthase [Leptospira sp.]|nr:5-(carboxyamino)imidazole ribonucleotide synthase [Leptospira sp.]
MIHPPAKLGVLGSGQLGRMFTQEAQKMGYQVICYSPDNNTPTGKAGASEMAGGYDDFAYLEEFLKSVSAVTFEFENIPASTLQFLMEYEEKIGSGFFSPSPKAVLIAQDRILEKNHLRQHNLPTVQYLEISTGKEDWSDFPFPAVIKTTRFGYDGKGQCKLETKEDLSRYLTEHPPTKDLNYVLEAYFPYDKEISIIYARDKEGKEFIFPPARNVHKDHILNITEFPAQLTETVHDAAISMASVLGRSLDYVGVMGIEFFQAGDTIVINEFAPRPHNSGHYTQEGSLISQFGLQLRIMTSQNLPEENQIRPVLMKNILGDNFEKSIQIAMDLLSRDSRYVLHLYQKEEPRKGRKMGHMNFLGSTNQVDKRFFGI